MFFLIIKWLFIQKPNHTDIKLKKIFFAIILRMIFAFGYGFIAEKNSGQNSSNFFSKRMIENINRIEPLIDKTIFFAINHNYAPKQK
ncbi:hypothetical protein BpHYR1_039384 [Brachionus plicatilis]|uniref:Uncharacterized protein n=1 Tax=Brachionus plicatilis TaxID=10195 RepID=A0A3M7SUG6_BRAPC|nr:hypothetical protein BpHYR1_039384 [Brachionus plicatilis]